MQENKSATSLEESHSDILSRTLLDNLAKMTPKQLRDESIVMSPEFMENLPQAEVKYLLDNFIPAEELRKIDRIQRSVTCMETAVDGSCCKFCGKPKRAPDEICCASKEIQVYLDRFEDSKLLKRFSSNALHEANASLENVKRIAEEERNIQERKSKISLDRFQSQKDRDKAKEEQFKASKFEKHRGTLLRVQEKMENMRKFCPELYNSNESVIAMWAGSPTYFVNEDKPGELKKSEM